MKYRKSNSGRKVFLIQSKSGHSFWLCRLEVTLQLLFKKHFKKEEIMFFGICDHDEEIILPNGRKTTAGEYLRKAEEQRLHSHFIARKITQ